MREGDDKMEGDASDRLRVRTLDDFLKGDFVPANQEDPVPPGVPDWMDWDKYRRGQAFFEENSHAVLTSNLISLLFIYMSPEHMLPMRYTGQVDTPEKSALRYLWTALHVKRWYQGNVFDPTDKAYRSIVKVRQMHAYVMSKVNVPSKKRNKDKKIYLSQCDMAFTQALFMGAVTLQPHRLGVHRYDQEDYEGFIFFWRVVGHLLGIEPEYNLCASNCYVTTRSELENLYEGFGRVRMRNLPPDFESTSQVFADGFRKRLNRNVVVRFLYYLVDEPCRADVIKNMTWRELLYYWFVRFHFSVLMRFRFYARYFNSWTCGLLERFEVRMLELHKDS